MIFSWANLLVLGHASQSLAWGPFGVGGPGIAVTDQSLSDGPRGFFGVINSGSPVGKVSNINGVQTYESSPQWRGFRNNFFNNNNDATNARFNQTLLFITDFYGIASDNNKLVADSFAQAGFQVIVPDLFSGDPVPSSQSENAVNLTEWRARHPTSAIDSIVNSTIQHIKRDLGVARLGAVGYCLGGKYVARYSAAGRGIDVAFVAHPSDLTTEEIQNIAAPISIAAGGLDTVFNAASRRAAEDTLTAKNATFESTLYAGVPHGWAVRGDVNIPRERFAKDASFLQAIGWLRTWL